MMGVQRKRRRKSGGNDEAMPTETALPAVTTAVADEQRSRLCTASVDVMVGREEERARVLGFLRSHLDQLKAASLYISGKPGCGKTLTVSKVLEEFKGHSNVAFGYINCMTVEPSAIYDRIAKELGLKLNVAGQKDVVKQLSEAFTSTPEMNVLVLDEIDQLASKGNAILYQLFEWPSLTNSNLIVIGIANALDLTDRILPLLCNRGCSPTVINFSPYKQGELLNILKQRLEGSKDDSDTLSPAALSYCAAKVTSFAGDARKALDICRRALEIRKVRPGESDIKIMLSIFSSMEGSSSMSLSALPKLQKMILCHICSLKLKKGLKATELFKSYSQQMQKKKLPVLGRDKFLDAIKRLQSASVVSLSGRKLDVSDSVVTLSNPQSVEGFLKTDVTWSMFTG